MSIQGASLPDSERELLERAAAWPNHRALDRLSDETLERITRDEGVDFATALLFERFQKSSGQARFMERINTLRRLPSADSSKIEAKLVIVPGALYLERPDLGGNGRIVREVAATLGLESDLIPLTSFGSVEHNAKLIRNWLEEHLHERIILVSVSKGGADLKLALSAGDAPRLFRNVVAWVNICGPLNGSRMANWILRSRSRTLFFRWKFQLQKRDFQFITDLRHGADAPLASSVYLPASMEMLSLIGFPMRKHMTTRFSRFCHRTLAANGPNDGTTSLADLQALPGKIYPVWGMDHYFRPESEARSLVSATLRYLAENVFSRVEN